MMPSSISENVNYDNPSHDEGGGEEGGGVFFRGDDAEEEEEEEWIRDEMRRLLATRAPQEQYLVRVPRPPSPLHHLPPSPPPDHAHAHEDHHPETPPYPLYARSKARVETLVHRAVRDMTEPIFREYVSYALEGGKRVRPVLALSLVDTLLERWWRERRDRRDQTPAHEREREGQDDDAGGLPAKVLRAAEMICLVPEILHCASLIADDLPCMDDAEERRGRPCMHRRYDEAVAVLTAVHLMTMSSRMIARAYRMLLPYGIGDADNVIALVEELSACMGFQGASGGQMLDLARVSLLPPQTDDDDSDDDDACGDGNEGGKGKEGDTEEERSGDNCCRSRRRREALKRMMCMKTSSFFRIALLSAVYVCSPVRLNDEVSSQLCAVSDKLGLAFQTFDDFDDVLEDDAQERSNNCVNVLGAQTSYERFCEYADHSVRLLRGLGLYNGVIQEFLDMMHRRILHKMEKN